jgi:hypothetical protein
MVVKITRTLKIKETRATEISNAPFRILLEGGSSLTLNRETCARYGIPLPLDLIGKMFTCSFESHELLFDHKNIHHVDIKPLESDDLLICSVQKNEVVSLHGIIPPTKYYEVSRILKLSSFSNGYGTHLSFLPCPFYEITLNLSDEEYEQCKVLPANTAFKASFKLLT